MTLTAPPAAPPWPPGAPPSPSGLGNPPATHDRPRAERPSKAPAVVLYLACFGAYVGIGMALSLHYHLVNGDAPSRVADAGYVVLSRYPHLAAVGFVWNPLPSLVEVPILALHGWWPALKDQGQAGTIMSALFMAGAVVQVRGIVLDLGLSRPWRWGLVAAFALNPMIVLYGGNGMSEASYLFFTIWAVRRLLRWVEGRAVTDLVVAGIALGLGYLARYETAAAALGAAALVVGVQVLRPPLRAARRRLPPAALDALLVGFPTAFTFIGWAVASWLITGLAFAQFSSTYGNSSVVSIASQSITASRAAAGGPLDAVLRDLLSVTPLLPVAVALALVAAVVRRRVAVAVPLAVFGAELAFEAAVNLSGSTFLWFRYWLTAVPMLVVVVATFAPRPGALAGAEAPDIEPPAGSQRRTVWVGRLLGLSAAVFLGTSMVTTWQSMLEPAVGAQEYLLRSVVDPGRHPSDRSQLPSVTSAQVVASMLDDMDLPRGSVLVDTFLGWHVWLASKNPEQFVIPSDYDFLRDLNAPARNGIRYILVSDPRVDGGVDAVNRRYPSLWRNGAGICTITAAVQGAGDAYDPSWRLCEVGR